ncbi:MAG: LON peptidase substrate-binding domain-containing protein [candidate division NC10 bacterium]|nr:LON peptidase substrate-binding domain-containing protein [candidate division NC10 bacterium]
MILPLFPLPDTVFFPHTLLPLHVFEPRYREMVADCLAGERRMAVVRLLPGWEQDYDGRPPIHTLAGAGEVVQAERLPDGRYNILLQGFARVLIEEEQPPARAYRVARCRPLEDRLPPEGMEALAPGLEAVKSAYLRLLKEVGRSDERLVRLVTDAPTPAALLDRVASVVVVESAGSQQILETLEVARRLDLVAAAVSQALLLVHRGGRAAPGAAPRWN